MKKRILPLLLTLCMVPSLLPVSVFADDAHVNVGSLEYEVKNGSVTITDCPEGARGTLEIPSTLDGYSVTAIGNGAFRHCDQITSATIPSTVTSIGEYAFADCSSLGGIVIPDSVTKIGMAAFQECTSLQSIQFSNNLTEIDAYMCQKDTSLVSVKLPSKVEMLGLSAFDGCKSLTSITLPNTLKEMRKYVFSDSGLESIVIPNSVETIDTSFFDAANLKSATLGNHVKVLGGLAFSGTALESIVIPDSVEELGHMAFSDCDNLKTATVGGGIKDLGEGGDRPFYYCKNLETLILRDGVKSLGSDEIFDGCVSLKTLYLPSSLNEIRAYTFKDCVNLTDIYFAGTAYAWGGMAIGTGNDPILNAKVHYVPFRDTKAGDYYYTPMIWAIDKGITAGTSETTFGPNDTCTQAQIITFLWRAAGSGSAGGGSPYTNGKIEPSQYYYTPLLWAYQQGVVTDKGLNPDAPCTRADVVTYLWRLANKPAGGSASFTDVPASADYAQAVSWAVKEGVTSGTSPTTFSPASICTRAQIVTFLYAALG